jgi:hypothetical protein
VAKVNAIEIADGQRHRRVGNVRNGARNTHTDQAKSLNCSVF